MIKNFFFLAFLCVLVSCQKESVELNSDEPISSKTMKTTSSGYGDLPVDVRDIIANGVDDHFGCEINNNKEALGGGLFGGSSSLGTYAYPYTINATPIRLLKSSLPCQPGIPYFIVSYLDKEGDSKGSEYSATFLLVSNPSYADQVRVVDIDWELNGQSETVPVQSFTINGIQIGESNSVACNVFSTANNVAVYSQEMTFDFELSIDLGVGVVIEFGSGYSYACTNTGITPIIAP